MRTAGILSHRTTKIKCYDRLNPPPRYALVEALLAEAAEDPRLRATLPFALDVSDPDQLEPELTETVEALRSWLETASPAAVAERLRRKSWPAGRPAPLRPLAQAALLSRLTADDRIMARPGLRWRLEPDGPEKIRSTARSPSRRAVSRRCGPSWTAP